MEKLNSIGTKLAKIEGIRAMTDVTGFGLLGHLTEMCAGSNISADLNFENIPIFKEVQAYIDQNCIPGGTYRNWDSYGQHVKLRNENEKFILCDPQTSGGLLIAVDENAVPQVTELLLENNIITRPFGRFTKNKDALIRVY